MSTAITLTLALEKASAELNPSTPCVWQGGPILGYPGSVLRWVLILLAGGLVWLVVVWLTHTVAEPVEVSALDVAHSVAQGRGSAAIRLTDPGLAPATLAEAAALFEPDELLAARERLETALSTGTDEGALCVLLSTIARRQGDAAASLEYGRRGAEALPAVGAAHHAYARAIGLHMSDGGLIAWMKNLPAWKQELRTAVELDPTNVEARSEEIFYFGFVPKPMGGDPERAQALLDELAELDSCMAVTLRATLLHVAQDRAQEAIALCRTALEENDCASELHFTLGSLLERGEDAQGADAEYALALQGERNESYYRALFSRARLRTAGEYEAREALAFLDEYLTDAPRGEFMQPRAQASRQRGLALQQLGRSEEARGAYELALELDPDLDEARAALDELP